MNYDEIFSISSPQDFEKLSLEIFRFQYDRIPVYRKFCDLLKIKPQSVSRLAEIPFLPIEFFKTHAIIPTGKNPQITFTSSGTTGSLTSKHYVSDLTLYERSFKLAFEQFYGDPAKMVILALLPSYLEREGSSLIYMAQHLIESSNQPESGFYLNNLQKLKETLDTLEKQGKKVLLIGVSFALLDLTELHSFKLKNTIIMETGGMKGRRREMIREELHNNLKKGFGVDNIHSEYGMTELLSQAYSMGDGVFESPPWMKLLIRDPEDALTFLPEGKTGGINVIDLANFNSCAFIATQDLGKDLGNNKTEVLGRFDNSDIRGCNLLVI